MKRFEIYTPDHLVAVSILQNPRSTQYEVVNQLFFFDLARATLGHMIHNLL